MKRIIDVPKIGVDGNGFWMEFKNGLKCRTAFDDNCNEGKGR